MSTYSFIDRLDKEQKDAVKSVAPHTLVVAGPGSGKTTVLTARYLKCLEEGRGPETICAITFTSRAALQMRHRIEAALGSPVRLPYVDTFHGLALRVLKKIKTFRLYGREETVEILGELGIKRPLRMAERLSLIKNMAIEEPSEEERETLRLYTQELERRGALDLDDLLLEISELLKKGDGPFFSHLLVDEFQDINPLQAYLIRLFVGQGSRLFAIGDPDQSIYGFRGANLDGFLGFTESFPGSRLVTLKRNYRSSETIVASATSVIEHNTRRIAHPVEAVRKGGEKIKHIRVGNDREEAEFVASQIESLMGGLSSISSTHHGCHYTFSDFAVLFRTHRQILLFEEVFRASSIPYRVVRPPQGMRMVVEGLKTMEDITPEAIAGLVESCAVAEELAGFVLTLAKECATTEELTERLLLMDTPDVAGIEADRVTLLTLHAAKGLEFKVVFVAGCDDGLIPLRGEEMEEERRLFYVAMTRAAERLYLTGAERRRLGDGPFRKSPFIDEIPGAFIEELSLQRKRRRPFQKGLFD